MNVTIKLLCLLATLFILSPAQAEQANKNQALTIGFNHVGLSVLSLKKSTAFFVDTLGFTLKGQDKEYPASFLTDGEMFLTLWQVKDAKTAVKFDRKNNVGLHHLAFSVASFEELDLLEDGPGFGPKLFLAFLEVLRLLEYIFLPLLLCLLVLRYFSRSRIWISSPAVGSDSGITTRNCPLSR